jgi:hypothetical protein
MKDEPDMSVSIDSMAIRTDMENPIVLLTIHNATARYLELSKSNHEGGTLKRRCFNFD